MLVCIPKHIYRTVILVMIPVKEFGKMPNKKETLIQKYKEWSARPVPTFDITDVDLTSMIDTGIDDKINTYQNIYDNVVPVAL